MSTVLVVQTDRQLSEEWSYAAESSGHAVICAHAIEDGVRRVREGGIDVILVDHGDSDDALAEFVNEIERLPDPPPFVLISDSLRAPEISAHLGAAAFLPKPCPLEEIVNILERFGAIPVGRFLEDEPTEPRGEAI
ncbi:MAG: hypothetical protein AAGC55_14855, partial [Myxococcota bacterium]